MNLNQFNHAIPHMQLNGTPIVVVLRLRKCSLPPTATPHSRCTQCCFHHHPAICTHPSICTHLSPHCHNTFFTLVPRHPRPTTRHPRPTTRRPRPTTRRPRPNTRYPPTTAPRPYSHSIGDADSQ